MRRTTVPAAKAVVTLFGCEVPRIWTRPLRPLTPETSRGFECIEFAEDVLGLELYPWQKWLLIHILEILEDGSYRFETVLVLVARQNGKTTVMNVLSLWRMFMDGARLVIGTAQNLDVAIEAWQTSVDLVTSNPELEAEVAVRGGIITANGKTSLKLRTGERYKVAAASRRGGRGLSGDLVLLDELREHQSWDAWAAVTNTTVAKALAMVAAFSNAGDAASIVLRALRLMALWQPDTEGGEEDRLLKEWADGTEAATLLAEMGDEDENEDVAADLEDRSLGIFEWSAPPGESKWKRENWAKANPSLNYGGMTEKKLASKIKFPDNVSRPENLCEWTSGSANSPFGPNKWEDCADVDGRIPEDSLVGLCVDVSAQRETAHVAVAGRREDGLAQVQVVASRAGTDWVVPWLRERLDGALPDRQLKLVGVTLQANGAPVASLLKEVQELCAEFGVPFHEWSGAELGRATGKFFDMVQGRKVERVVDGKTVEAFEPLLKHRNQPVLNVAATTANIRRAGDAFIWDRHTSPMDIAPLVAVTGALWVLTDHVPAAKKKSRYMTGGLVVTGR